MRPPVFDHIHQEMRTRLRGVFHLVAAALSPFPTLWLLTRAGSGTARASVLVYGLGFMFCVLFSGVYHRFTRSARAQTVMQTLDHAGIFLLVAGTYTPLLLLAVPAALRVWSVTLVWAAAALGVVLRALRRAPRFVLASYLILGWLALPLLPLLDPRAGTLVVGLLLAGGVVYTFGATLFLRRLPRLRSEVFGFHEVWHLLTLAAASTHFLAVWVLVGRLS